MDMSNDSDLGILPVLLHELQVASYIAVGSLSVFIYDVLSNLRKDYDLLKTHGVDAASACYFISRLSTFGFVLSLTLSIVQPMHQCEALTIIVQFSYILFVTSTLLLSYIRVCAVWNRSLPIVAIFGLLWLSAVAGSFTNIKGEGLSSGVLPGSNLCLEFLAHPYLAAAIILPTTNHLIVFIAITIGLCRYQRHNSIFDLGKGVRLYIFGDTLPAFSKALLQSSQICYSIAVAIGCATLIWFYVCDSNSSYRLLLFPLYAPVVNIMFSWVFRKAKLGIFTVIPHAVEPTPMNAHELPRTRHVPIFKAMEDQDAHSVAHSSRFSSIHNPGIRSQPEDVDLGRSYSPSDDSQPFPVRIEVEKVVEYGNDLGAAEIGGHGMF
ncbi:hypothetical protein D9613_009385 [Agrocybe pediades]|uniref:Uncharacterized protein n=1 Tax=Agrocybe pediades TaxID=84607 RepID=A0A8H4R2J4_9AGAR|nr:hypothetical protein D9613_009385 [Agrocybe pediades]KAF9559835.1 hypothetical protein CPC08DRAFT_818523 [Agrocybe pediades]